MSRWPVRTVAERLWALIDTTGGSDECWPWKGKTSNGYGYMWFGGGKYRGAHAVALELTAGEAPSGCYAIHSCDFRACCNPRHLRWGSPSDNNYDMYARGGRRTKLTAEDVVAIRRRRAAGEGCKAISRDYPNVSEGRIYNVARGLGWARLEVSQ